MSQSKINVEADAGRLLAIMIAYDRCSALMIHQNGWEAAVSWLVKKEYAHHGAADDWFYIDDRGREYFAGLCANPSVTESPRAWVEEARSQLAMKAGPVGTVTRESTISRACIPGPSPPRTPRSPEDMVADMERDMAAQIRWCERLGVSPDEMRELLADGRVKTCGACGEVGIFDRPGKGERKKCRKCLGGGR